MNDELERCLACNRSSEEVPLVLIRHQGENYWICPQHFPILIHKPGQLVDKLPGARNLDASEGH
ncbi:MAG: hypothetical protein A2Z16_14495 [Chloroflexi bacterium RBG_16_54_18]|nr:MAG: hypothetical protein A2Z16_14495 [Chloroflexi bacterium RBG_16_54_18]